MILDTSAIISILIFEPGSEDLLRKIESTEYVAIGTPTLFETALALTNKLGVDAFPMVEGFITRCNVRIVAFTRDHLHAAVSGFHRFGKGRHKAKLNLGDCMTYAIASVAGMPLLFTGNDFTHTDLERA